MASITMTEGDLQKLTEVREKLKDLEQEDLNNADLTDSIFEKLENLLDSPAFLEKLKRRKADSLELAEHSSEQDVQELEDSFVIVTKDDAIEGMTDMIAGCVLANPEAQKLSPNELQAAILTSCKEFKKSKLRQAWGVFTLLYRAASWSYTAFNIYANPWIVRAIILALAGVPKVIWTLLV